MQEPFETPTDRAPPPAEADQEEFDFAEHIGEAETQEEADDWSKLAAKVPLVETFDQLKGLAEAEVPYVWGEAVVRGTINLFSASPGAGKSTLLFMLMLARCGVAKRAVLGMTVQPALVGKKVVLIEEAGSESTARKLFRTAASMGFKLDKKHVDDRLKIIASQSLIVGDMNWMEILHKIKRNRVSDIFIDTLASVSATDDANSESEQIKVFKILHKAIRSSGRGINKPTIWIAAHSRKGGGSDLDDVAGSLQRTGQCDSVMMMAARRSKGQVTATTVTFAKLRDEPDNYPQPITYRVTKTGVELLKIDKKGAVVAEAPADSPKPTPVQSITGIERVFQAVRDAKQRPTQNQVFKTLKTLDNAYVLKYLKALCTSGRIESRLIPGPDGKTVQVYGLPAPPPRKAQRRGKK